MTWIYPVSAPVIWDGSAHIIEMQLCSFRQVPLSWTAGLDTIWYCVPRVDVPVVVGFAAPMTPEQQHWLRATAVRVRYIVFSHGMQHLRRCCKTRLRW